MLDTAGADEWHGRVLAEPAHALAEIDRNGSGFTEAEAHWLRGLAQRELGNLDLANSELLLATQLSTDSDDISARARSTRSLVLLTIGQTDEALAEAESAAASLKGLAAARNTSQRALILQRLGRHDEALAMYDLAFELMSAVNDKAGLVRMMANRAALRAYQGDLPAARVDLERAIDIATAAGDRQGHGHAVHNLGFVESRAGNIPLALARFDEAMQLLSGLLGPARLAAATLDRASVLADAGLLEEATQHAADALRIFQAADMQTEVAEAELLAARLALAGRRFMAAREQAESAGALFEELDRQPWARQAAWIALTASYEGGEPIDVREARQLASDLAEAGWHLESQSLLLAAADVSVQREELDLAREIVRELRHTKRDVPAMVRVGHHRAVARTRFALGDRTGARRAVTAGLKLLHEHRVTFGSAELRAHASWHGRGLHDLALRLALEDDRPDDVLVTLELLRDTEQPVWGRPPVDPELAAYLAELRRLDARGRDAAREGIEDREAAVERVDVERRIRDRLRQRRGRTLATERLDIPDLKRRLDGRVLRSWFVHDHRLGVVTVDARRRRLEMLGPVDAITDQIDVWRFAIRRLAESKGSERRLADAAQSAGAAATRLGSLLGLDDQPAGTPLVVVPTGVLRGLTWHALPVLAGSPVSVVPSARHWLTTHEVVPASSRVLVAAGPGLIAADREASEVASHHTDAKLLAHGDATADAVVKGLDGAAIGHLAAHGTFRWDNPLFSALQFEDGPVWLHDFERLAHAPHTLVLSSCDMAMDRVVAGDAVLGMASGLLQLGVASLIAPVVPVPDEEVADFMIALHERMAAGATGSEALAATAAAFDGDTPRRQAVRQSFVAFGA